MDKLQFAKLVAFVSRICARNDEDDEWIIKQLDELTQVVKCDAEVINDLMRRMCEGTNKIEAIKLHRQLTGYGLKESKDAVEKYWLSKPVEVATD